MRHSFLALCLVVGCTKTAAKAPESSQPDSVPEPPAAPQVEVPPPTDPIVWLSSTATRLSAQVEDATDLVQKTDDIPKLIEGQFWRDHLTQAASALCDAQRTLAKPPLTIPEAQAPNLEALRAAASDVCALHGALDSVAKGERQGLADLLDSLQAAQQKINSAVSDLTPLLPGRAPAASSEAPE